MRLAMWNRQHILTIGLRGSKGISCKVEGQSTTNLSESIGELVV